MGNLSYGENLRIIRQTKGISQEAMAMNLNISQASYCRIEKQAIMRDSKLNVEIARVLEVNPLDLLPQQEELKPDDMIHFKGAGTRIVSKTFQDTPIGRFVLWSVAVFVTGLSFDISNGFCRGLQVPTDVIKFVNWTTALTTAVCLYFLIRKNKN